MIVLDTNVLSEPLRSRPDPSVMRWLERVTEEVAVTAITVGEILNGVRALPEGRRRDGLMIAVDGVFGAYADRVLPYDESAARVHAEMRESRRASGRALSVEDGMIAAICSFRGHQLATRNTKDFQELALSLIDPWDARSS